MKKFTLTTRQLLAKQSISQLGFKSTDELDNYTGILGQDRATSAIQFGLAMQQPGYNIFVMGEPGTGRMSYIRSYLEQERNQDHNLYDWLYVNNFKDERSPKALKLPVGVGKQLQNHFEKFVDNLLLTFPAAFEERGYQKEKASIEQEFNKRYDQAINFIEQEALKKKIAFIRDQESLNFSPMQKGKIIDDTQFAQLPTKTRSKFNDSIDELEKKLNTALLELPQWRRESNEKVQQLNKKTIDLALTPLLKIFKKNYDKHPSILEYIEAVKENLHQSAVELFADERMGELKEDLLKKKLLNDMCVPNLLVEHKKESSMPVVHETHPSYRNLFGCVEYTSEMGAIVTNYQQIRAGSLHRANGGFLLLDANKVLEESFVWSALKRSVKEKQLKIESPNVELGIFNPITLDPEIMDLNIKIILIGSRDIYYLLQEVDPDFHEMFKVLVDFEDYIARDESSIRAFAQLLKNRIDSQGYPALTVHAVARLVELSSRMAEHQQEISASFGDMFDLLAEADFIRGQTPDKKINEIHVDQAWNAKLARTSRVSQQILKDMLDDTILINTDGSTVGKINGLTVLSIGESSFGMPARITASVYPGSQGVIDIEKESQLGQSIHSKGVMIISGYLGKKYAQTFQLSMTASITMEQSYGYVDGDSASLAELCCLLSSLTDTPINQSLAVTGSINQDGQVQAIGGVNEKIEGFFDLCLARGLTGNQGVIIPISNVRNLMLHPKVVDAVRTKQFAVYAVTSVDEALELLTGCKSGKLSEKKVYPKGSLNFQIVQRLKAIAKLSNHH